MRQAMADAQCPHCGQWNTVPSTTESICPNCRRFFRPAEGACRTSLPPPPPANWHPVLATAVEPREVRGGFAAWFRRQCDSNGSLSFACQLIILIWTPLAIAMSVLVYVEAAVDKVGTLSELVLPTVVLAFLLSAAVDVPAGIVAIATNQCGRRRTPPRGLR